VFVGKNAAAYLDNGSDLCILWEGIIDFVSQGDADFLGARCLPITIGTEYSLH